MVIGFVLITCRPNMERKVCTELMRLKEVEEAELLFGEYDILLKVNANDFNQIGKIVINKIRSLDGVIDTKTLPGITL